MHPAPPINRSFLFVVRVTIAAVWLYQGFWLKIVAADPNQQTIVAAVGGPFPAPLVLQLIGWGETLIAIAVLLGVWPKLMAGLQIALVASMNATAIAFGAIEDPFGLVVHNLPFLLCVFLLGIYDRGWFFFRAWDRCAQPPPISSRE